MCRIFYVIFALSLFLQPSIRAKAQAAEAGPTGEDIGAALLVGAGLGVMVFGLYKPISLVITHEAELSEGRMNKYVLLEAGKANEDGSSFAVQAFINEDSLLLARLSEHLSPGRNINFKSYEIGFRQYFSLLFVEMGLFNARHQQSQDFYKLDSFSPQFRFDAYETKGGFFSLGAAVMLWRVSLGLRGTIHRGLSIHTVQTYENHLDPGEESKKEARDQYKLRGTGYLDLGFAI